MRTRSSAPFCNHDIDHDVCPWREVIHEHEITSLVWHEQGQRIEVNYLDSDPDHMEGEERVIREMAEDEGLVLVSTEGGIRRWVRP